ncbi:MAG: hypothetical protein ABI315_05760 [Bacteroidia bacterium]
MNQFIYHSKIVFTCLFLASLFSSLSAQEIERKIIIKNNKVYYATIDEELQLAKLHVSNMEDPLKKAKVLTMPAGRNYSEPIIPLCWDIADKNIFAVNFITNATNSRILALKVFSLSSLKEWTDRESAVNQLEMSFQQNTLTYFDPYDFVTDRSSILENFFFDGIALSDSAICMAIANRGELSIWKYEQKKWEHSEIINLPVDNYFSLVTHKQNVYLILSTGKIYSVSINGIKELPEKKLNALLPEIVLLINKKDDTIKYIQRKNINKTTPFNELINKNVVNIF